MPATSMRFLLNNIKNFLIDYGSGFETTSPVVIAITDVIQNGNASKHGKQVERVPPVFRNKQSHRDAYDPVIVSIGPYYHGKDGYDHAESFKEKSLHAFLSDTQLDKSFFEKKILDNIEKIRGSYEKLDPRISNEKILTSIILKDACFFIYYVKNQVAQYSMEENKENIFYQYFGPARLKFIFRDLLLVENQIPFWIIELLMESTDGGVLIWNILLYQFMSNVIAGYVGNSETEIKKPLHFLGAYYQALKVQIPFHPGAVSSEISLTDISMVEKNQEKSNTYRFRSITNLKAKGIHFKLSKSNAISFHSYKLYGQLHIPPLVFSTDFFVLYSNIIAYEMSASSNTEFNVSSWVNFMKSLIDSPSDVKILREKGILLNDMVGDDEVVKIIKDLDTFGLENINAFSEVRDAVQKHCRSKAKTWAAELIHTYFESPWNTIALLAALLVIILTFIQTYFTVNPAS